MKKKQQIQRKREVGRGRQFQDNKRPTHEEITQPATLESGAGQLMRLPDAVGTRSVRQGTLLQLQERRGNAFVQSLLHQQYDNKLIMRQDAGVIDASGEIEAFQSAGPYPHDEAGQTIQPPTNRGGFNARYDARSMDLSAVVNIAMTFVDGLAVSGDVVSANDPSLQRLADAVNRLRGERRRRAVQHVRDNWQWNGTEDDWMSVYSSSVGSAWSGNYTFQSSKPGWEEQLAHVLVTVNTTKAVAAGPTAPPAAASGGPIHCQATVYKTAPVHELEGIVAAQDVVGTETYEDTVIGGNELDIGAEVGQGDPNVPTDQTLTLGSDQAITDVQKLTHSVHFGHNSDVVSSSERAELDQFITSFQAPAGGEGAKMDIIGHANTVGGTAVYNLDLSQRRAQSVADYLKTAVVNGNTLANAEARIQTTAGQGTEGATASAHWRRVDVIIAGGPKQDVAVHEFGHLIGLGDEYATPAGGLLGGSPGNIGDAAGHDQLSRDMGLGGATKENDDSIMSLGNTIRPQHYATFMFALRRVTGMDEWRIRS
jgi:outer membrane protein OmpA-like peptidoglycan-associated protein